jgi:hypothetical protein
MLSRPLLQLAFSLHVEPLRLLVRLSYKVLGTRSDKVLAVLSAAQADCAAALAATTSTTAAATTSAAPTTSAVAGKMLQFFVDFKKVRY